MSYFPMNIGYAFIIPSDEVIFFRVALAHQPEDVGELQLSGLLRFTDQEMISPFRHRFGVDVSWPKDEG